MAEKITVRATMHGLSSSVDRLIEDRRDGRDPRLALAGLQTNMAHLQAVIVDMDDRIKALEQALPK